MRSAKLIPNVEVAIWVMVLPAPPTKSWKLVIVERPVPPRVAARVPVVSESAMFNEEVAESVYVPPVFPTKSWPKVGTEVMPVPPRAGWSVPVVSESAMLRDDVASCCQLPPAYEPRRIPAAVGDAIPVPPPPAPRRPARVFANVMVLPLAVMVVDAVSPLYAVDEVARVIAEPVWSAPTGPIEVIAAVRYVLVSTERVPSPLMVLTNPFEVRLERREID